MYLAEVKQDGLGALQGFLSSSNRVGALAPGTSLSAHRFSMVLPPGREGGREWSARLFR